MEIVTANELLSGAVIYLGKDGAWYSGLDQARLFGPDDVAERDALIEKARASGRIVGVEIEKVSTENGTVIPNRLRERIRANGPTAPYGPERQDLEEPNVSL